MGWPSEIVMVRHAESAGNVLDCDARAAQKLANYAFPLTERGREQARMTGEYLRQHFPDGFDVRYTSYYERAKETMRIICPGERFYEDPRLAEAQRGIYHTMTTEQIASKFPEELERKAREGLYHYRPPGGENWPDIELRVHSFLGTLNRDCEGKRVLIVVHGHWLLLLDRLINHFDIDEAIRRYEGGFCANAAVTVWRSDASGKRLRPHSYTVPWQEEISCESGVQSA